MIWLLTFGSVLYLNSLVYNTGAHVSAFDLFEVKDIVEPIVQYPVSSEPPLYSCWNASYKTVATDQRLESFKIIMIALHP